MSINKLKAIRSKFQLEQSDATGRCDIQLVFESKKVDSKYLNGAVLVLSNESLHVEATFENRTFPFFDLPAGDYDAKIYGTYAQYITLPSLTVPENERYIPIHAQFDKPDLAHIKVGVESNKKFKAFYHDVNVLRLINGGESDDQIGRYTPDKSGWIQFPYKKGEEYLIIADESIRQKMLATWDLQLTPFTIDSKKQTNLLAKREYNTIVKVDSDHIHENAQVSAQKIGEKELLTTFLNKNGIGILNLPKGRFKLEVSGLKQAYTLSKESNIDKKSTRKIEFHELKTRSIKAKTENPKIIINIPEVESQKGILFNLEQSKKSIDIYSEIGATSLTIQDLKAGKYKISLKDDFYQKWTKTINVKVSKSYEVDYTPEPVELVSVSLPGLYNLEFVNFHDQNDALHTLNFESNSDGASLLLPKGVQGKLAMEFENMTILSPKIDGQSQEIDDFRFINDQEVKPLIGSIALFYEDQWLYFIHSQITELRLGKAHVYKELNGIIYDCGKQCIDQNWQVPSHNKRKTISQKSFDKKVRDVVRKI